MKRSRKRETARLPRSTRAARTRWLALLTLLLVLGLALPESGAARPAVSEWVKPGENIGETVSRPAAEAAVTAGAARTAITPVPPRTTNWELGLYLPLSGAFAGIGRDFAAGVDCVLAARNGEHDPRPWRRFILDSAALPPGPALERLRRAGVAVILGPVRVSRARELVAVRKTADPPLILWAPQPQLCRGQRGVFQHLLSTADQARALGRRLQRTAGNRKQRVAMLLPDNEFGHAFATALQPFLDTPVKGRFPAPAPGKTVFYAPETIDFSTAITALRAVPPAEIPVPDPENGAALATAAQESPPRYPFTALVVADFYPRLRLLLPQLTFHGLLEAKLFGPRFLADERLLRESAARLEGAVCCLPACELPDPPAAVAAWRRHFQAFCGRPPTLYACYAADTITLLDKARKQVERGKTADLSTALLQLPPVLLLSGPTRVTPDGVFTKELDFLTCRNGIWQPETEIEPESKKIEARDALAKQKPIISSPGPHSQEHRPNNHGKKATGSPQ